MTDTSNTDSGDSWLSQIAKFIGSGFTPDTMPAWGALAGLGQAATPHAGRGMGWGNALIQTAADVGKDAVAGYKSGLESKQKQMMLDYYQNMMGGQPSPGAGNNLVSGGNPTPGSLNGGTSQLYAMQQRGMALTQAPDPTGNTQRAGAQLIQAVKSVIGEGKELNPDGSVTPLAGYNKAVGLTEATKQEQTPRETAQKTYQFMTPPALQNNFGSLAPAVTSSALQDITANREPAGQGPGNQTPPDGQGQEVPPVDMATLMAQQQPPPPPPPPGANQLPPQPPAQGMAPQGDALAAYRQQQGMPAPPIDAQRGAMGIPIGSSSPQPLPPQGQPPMQGQPQGMLPQAPAPRQAAFMPPQAVPPQGQMATPQPNPLSSLIAQQQNPQAQAALQQYPNIAKGSDGTPLVAGDGKPLLPQLANNPTYAPSKTGPVWNTTPSENTNTAVAATNKQVEKNISDLSEGTSSMGELASVLSNEQAATNKLTQLFQQTKMGGAVQNWPDIVREAAAAGFVTDPSTIHSLADTQQALAISLRQVLGDLKNTSIGGGEGTPMRIFGTEVSASLEKAINPQLQPDALFGQMSFVNGVTGRGLDALKQWDVAGGRNNTLDNGRTMLPADYMRQFTLNHPIDAYSKSWEQNTAPFAGMKGSSGTNNWIRVNGKLVQQ